MQSGVNFKLEVWDKAGTCILYSEEHLSEDLSQTKGGFALAVGRGTSTNNYLESSALFTSKIFENNGVVAGGWANCAAGATFASGDERTIRVHYDLGGGYIAMTPDVPIASSAYAIVSETLQGKRPADFVQVRDDVAHDLNQANIENVFTSANYLRLQQLLSPSASITFNNQKITNLANPTAAQDASTKDYTDKNLGGRAVDLVDVAPGFGNGKVLTWDSTAAKWVAQIPTVAGTAGGDLTGSYPNPTVANLAIGTSKLADNAVTPSKIKSAGLGPNQLVITDNLTGSTFNYASCANNEVLKFVTGTGWQCATVASLSAVTSVNGKSGTVVLNANDLSLGTASMRNIGIGTSDVPELGAGGKLAVGVIPNFAGDITGAYTNAWVAKIQGRDVANTNPGVGDILKWNNALSRWEPGAVTDNGITALTGDISASGNGAVAATLTNGVVTTPKIFTNPGANRLVATDNGSGATLVPFTCNLNETMQWTSTGWSCVTASTLVVTGFIADGGNTRGSTINIGTNDNFALNLETNDTPRLTILNGGNVGIGTTAPGYALEAAGTVNARAFTQSLTGISQNVFNALTWMHVNNGGVYDPYSNTLAVPAGTSARLNNTSSAAGTVAGVTISAGNGTATGYIAAVTPAAGNTPAIVIGQQTGANAYQERMRIDEAGKVGIGTTAPARLLHVAGAMRVDPAALPASPAAGDLAIDSGASNSLKYHNGTNWISLAVGGTGDFKADGTVAMTGALRHLAGTAANPGMTFAGDTGNGIFAPVADNLGFATAATERMRILANGNVGIGTTNPAQKLDVAGSGIFTVSPGNTVEITTPNGQLGLKMTGVASRADVRFENNSLMLLAGNGTGIPASTNGISVTTAGLVGVGTTTPAGILDVRGGTAAAGNAQHINIFAQNGQASGATNGGHILLMPGVQNGAGARGVLSIGSTAPDSNYMLNVMGSSRLNGDVAIMSNNGGIYASPTGTSLPSMSGAIVTNWTGGDNRMTGYRMELINAASTYQRAYIGAVSNTAGVTPTMVFGQQTAASAATERMRIDAAGNVGIGTTNPAKTLTVTGDGLFSNELFIGSDMGAGRSSFSAASGQPLNVATYNGLIIKGFGTEYARFNANGMRLAPTVNPAAPIAGDIFIDSAGANTLKYHNGSSWQTIATGTSSQWITTGGNIYYPTGNVGIGTSTPASRFEVNGNITGSRFVTSSAYTNTVLIGDNTSVTNNFGTIVGSAAQSTLGYGVVALGYGAQVSGDRSIAIGIGASVTGQQSVAIGQGAVANGSGSLAIGRGAAATTSNEAVIGGSDTQGWIDNVFIGNGKTNAAPVSFSLNASGGSGVDVAGGNVMIKGGKGTGSGAGGYVGFETATAGGSSNSVLNPTVERMRITPAGNVGIGTTSPARLLDVRGAVDIWGGVNSGYTGSGGGFAPSSTLNLYNGFSGDGNGTFTTFLARNSNGNNQAAFIGAVSTTGAGAYMPAMVFGATSAGGANWQERMRIDTTGNVGIGTTAPNRLLQVAGAMKLSPSANPASPAAGDIYIDSAAANALKYHNGTAWVSVGSGGSSQWNTVGSDINYVAGNVGIGTSTPVRTFDLRAGGTGSSTDFNIARISSTDKQRMIDIGQQHDTGGDARLFLQGGRGDADAETGYLPYDLLINPKGGTTIVGPGISNYRKFSTALDVRGPNTPTLDNWGTMSITTTDNQGAGIGGQLTLGGQYQANGMAGFATIAGKKENSTSGNWLGYMAFGILPSSGVVTEAMRINSSGYLGIGTTTPTKMLHVAGETYSAGNLSVGSIGSANAAALIYQNSSSGGTSDAALLVRQDGANPIAIFQASGGGEKMRVLANGNIGIGITAPSSAVAINSLTASIALGDLSNSGAAVPGLQFMDVGSKGVGFRFDPASSSLIFEDASGNYVPSTWYTAANSNFIVRNGSVGIGMTAPTQKLEVNGNVLAAAYLYSSDVNLKKNIRPIEGALEKTRQLRGVNYEWIAPDSPEADKTQLGVVAQDVEKVFPEAVVTGKDGYKRVNYPSLIAPLIEAINELYKMWFDQSQEIDKLKAENIEMKNKNLEMEKRLERLEKAIRAPAGQ